MHEFLKAIGFSDLKTKKELKEILSDIEKDFSAQQTITVEENVDYSERKRNLGIT